MNCDQTKPLLHAYLDKQLDAANTVAVEKHLLHCTACNHVYAGHHNLQQSLRKTLPYYSAPANLQQHILQALDKPSATSTIKIWHKWRNIRYGLSFAASLILGIVLVNIYQHQRNETLLIESILSSHINALSANRLTDIQSAQVEQLAPWFTSKLDYSPRVYNLSEQGFSLLGARLDSLQKQRIASLTYQHKHHVVNLYTWPSPDIDDAAQESHQQQGYNLIYWCQNNMNYWVVSDIDSDEIQQFAALIRQRLSTANK